jgi:hypothetical protein
VVDPSAASTRSIVVNSRSTRDAEAAVQDAIERFRITYNARLLKHREVRPGRQLKFQLCDVTIDVVQATATCGVISRRSDEGEPPPVWTFTLERDDDSWAIRSILTEDVP